ncbi:MAG: cell division protein ZapA [Bacteroidota bacterium]|nr:cell division protein ZapA [Bacteroidota bacterium]
MTSPLIPLNILIGDRTYRIKILPSDEETVRGTLKIINDKILEFRTQYSGKDMQDYISMVLIWFATESQNTLGADIATKNIQGLLQKMENQIDDVLP